jgi:hypothetical protein
MAKRIRFSFNSIAMSAYGIVEKVLQFCGSAVLQFTERSYGIILQEEINKKVMQSCSLAKEFYLIN